MTKHSTQSTSALWARFRFSVVGALLSAPPARGELQAALEFLAAKKWTHPVTGREVCFAAKTIERWLYRARREQDDPVGVLRRAVRKDCGKVSLNRTVSDCWRPPGGCGPGCCCWIRWCACTAWMKTTPEKWPNCWPTSASCSGNWTSR